MYILIFIFLSFSIMSQDCNEINKKIIESPFEEAIKYQKKYYNICKEDCSFLRLLVESFAKASEDDFKFLNENDIDNAIKCDVNIYKRKSPAGLREGIILYYLRKNRLDKLFEIYKEEEIRQHVGYYIYYKYIKSDIKLGCNIIENENKEMPFLTISEALLLHECGNKDKAREIAAEMCKEEINPLKGLSKENSHEILKIMNCKKILGLKNSEEDLKILEEAKSCYSYFYKLYGY